MDLRVPLTVLLGRSQLLQWRVREGQVTTAHDCMETLVQIDGLVWSLDRLLADADARAASAAADGASNPRT